METNQLLFNALFFSVGAFLMYLILRSSKKNESNISSPTMSSITIKTMVNNYRNQQLAVINNTMGINDAQSIWFSLNTVKKFALSIENESRKVSPNIKEADLGIRFYYASYPKQQDWENIDLGSISKDYAERHTLIMIPTLNRKNDEGELINCDFNPLDPSTYSRDKNQQQPAMKIMALSNNTSSSDVMGQNHGQLIPPAKITGQEY